MDPLGGNPFSPWRTLARPLLSPLQRLSGPSPFFVALRGYLFAFSRPSWTRPFPRGDLGGSLSSLLQPLSGPSWRPSWTPFVALSFLGEPLLSPLQRLSGPSPFLVALRGNMFFLLAPFVDLRFLGGPLSSPLQPLSGPLPSFVALRGNLFVFLSFFVSSRFFVDPLRRFLLSPDKNRPLWLHTELKAKERGRHGPPQPALGGVNSRFTMFLGWGKIPKKP